MAAPSPLTKRIIVRQIPCQSVEGEGKSNFAERSVGNQRNSNRHAPEKRRRHFPRKRIQIFSRPFLRILPEHGHASSPGPPLANLQFLGNIFRLFTTPPRMLLTVC